MPEKFGKTWLGEHWLRSLENVDYDNRLPRGASYARNGYVKSIKTTGNQIIAKVAGSRATPYKVTIANSTPKFSPLPKSWDSKCFRANGLILRCNALVPIGQCRANIWRRLFI